ncbi:MAG: hypothetical protein ACKN9F_07735 [Methylomonas sp.]
MAILIEKTSEKPCALCFGFRELQRSHAIPNSFFKKVINGRQATVVTKNGKCKPSNSSWASYQLCYDCENHLNKSYEQYSVSFLKGKRGIVNKNQNSIEFYNLEIEIIYLFFLSVFWRAANSEIIEYSKVVIPDIWSDRIRKSIANKDIGSSELVKVRLSRLIYKDETEKTKQLIAIPFCRQISEQNFCFCFVFGGFFIEFFLPSIDLCGNGVVTLETRELKIPFIDLYNIPELFDIVEKGCRA